MNSPDSALPATRQTLPVRMPVATPEKDGLAQDGLAHDGREPDPPEPARNRTPAEIEQDLQATTDRLAARVDELVDRVHPKQVARRGVATVQDKLTTPQGRPRAELVGAAIGGLAGLAALVWRARRRR